MGLNQMLKIHIYIYIYIKKNEKKKIKEFFLLSFNIDSIPF